MNLSKTISTPAAQSPARKQSVRFIVVLGALSALGPFSIDMYLPAFPALAREFGASPAQTQLTLSACLLGLSLGQLLAGPLSDAQGRRRPLLIGMGAYAAASLLCAFAPSIGALIALRFVQGFAGAAGIVIARAVVRDLYTGVDIARFFSVLMIVSGLAPILAPVLGGQVLRFTSWRGVFVTLAVVGVLLLAGAAKVLGETLPAHARQNSGLRATLLTFRGLLIDRTFMSYAVVGGLASAALFAYISGSSFVLQEIYGVSPQFFSVLFGANAFGIVVAGQINGRIVGRISPQRLLLGGLAGSATAGLALLALITGGAGLGGVMPALFVVIASLGFVMPNATTLALMGAEPRTAGSASALMGMLGFAVGAVAAPLVGIAGVNALPMALVIAFATLSALALCFYAVRRTGTPPAVA